MASYPVYDVSRADHTRDCDPIGHASTEGDALALLARHFDGTGADAPTTVELNARDVASDQLWGWWLA